MAVAVAAVAAVGHLVHAHAAPVAGHHGVVRRPVPVQAHRAEATLRVLLLPFRCLLPLCRRLLDAAADCCSGRVRRGFAGWHSRHRPPPPVDRIRRLRRAGGQALRRGGGGGEWARNAGGVGNLVVNHLAVD